MGQSVCTDYDEIQRNLQIVRNMTLGETLRWHRKDRLEMKQEVLAWETKLNTDTISDIENGIVRNPHIVTLVALCIGMKLNRMYVADILSKSAYFGFLMPMNTAYDKTHLIYCDVILRAEDLTINEFYKILENNGISSPVKRKASKVK